METFVPGKMFLPAELSECHTDLRLTTKPQRPAQMRP
jgi:hypothetical protein